MNIMGGKVLETESERLLRIGRKDGEEKGIRYLVETCQEVGLSITDAAEKLVSKFGLSEDVSFVNYNQAKACLLLASTTTAFLTSYLVSLSYTVSTSVSVWTVPALL